MRPEFEILPGEFDPSKTDLICEVSDSGCCFFFQDHERKFILGLSLYCFSNNTTIDEMGLLLTDIINQEVLAGSFHTLVICYSYKDSVLLPGSLFIEGGQQSMIQLVHGDLYESHVMTDVLREKNIYNVYSVPLAFHKVMADKFPAASFIHQHSVLIKGLPAEGNVMNVIVYQNKIVLSLIKTGKLQIIQSFHYETTEDAVYHMLNTCHQFGVDEVQLQLSGLIEMNSALYRRLHNYFLFIKFSQIPEGITTADGIKEFPNHYFSHLFSIYSCV